MKMNLLKSTGLALLLFLGSGTVQAQRLDSVPGDPMHTKIYTLPNGLKVYMSVNKATPRIQTSIAVRVGGKNDPAETTGLAHYFEHIMFKGTPNFGTSDYNKERPLLEEIEELYERHRATQNANEKARLYRAIDSVSYLASKYAIPNEYDKLMATIGAKGTNAYTGYDQTVYLEDIPSNQLDNWARIQADRFESPVIRGFHTELEAVYEEKNMSLTQDNRKAMDAIMQGLFPTHPYGTQTVLGTQYDLKNPSIRNIRAYHKKYYVPNNMAICMAGDFDPEEAIKTIERYFGHLKPNPQLPKYTRPNLPPLTRIVEKKVYGQEAQNIMLGWRIPSTFTPEGEVVALLSSLLNNGKTGLIDVNLLLQQQLLAAGTASLGLADNDVFMMYGIPKEGQSLDEVRTLLLNQIELIKKGDFDETLLKATINNYKLSLMNQLESNQSRTESMVYTFINDVPLSQTVHLLERLSKVTKQDLIRFAQQHLGNNYTIVYKLQGEDKNVVRMEKPNITPIEMNRDKVSSFLTQVAQTPVKPIEPVFVEYNKVVKVSTNPTTNQQMLYTHNGVNDIFTLTYLIEPGLAQDKVYTLVPSYLALLGTNSKSPYEINKEFYEIACDYSIRSMGDRLSITLHGLQENMEQAVALLEDVLNNAKGDTQTFEAFKSNLLTEREVEMKAQTSNFNALRTYMIQGPNYIKQHTLSNAELQQVTKEEVLQRIHNLLKYPHRILYYGPATAQQVQQILAKAHPAPTHPLTLPAAVQYKMQPTPTAKVFLAEYDAPNFNMFQYNNTGLNYDLKLIPQIRLYNTYFGDGMSSIVFQELRESRGLAYAVASNFASPSRTYNPFSVISMITSQNDKLKQGITVFSNILENMPSSPAAFTVAKESLIASMRTHRVHPSNYISQYIMLEDWGIKSNPQPLIYEQIQKLTLQDIQNFHKQHVKGRTYQYGILGKSSALDIPYLQSLGEVQKLSQQDIFGF